MHLILLSTILSTAISTQLVLALFNSSVVLSLAPINACSSLCRHLYTRKGSCSCSTAFYNDTNTVYQSSHLKLDPAIYLPKANIATTLNCPIALQEGPCSLFQYINQLGCERGPLLGSYPRFSCSSSSSPHTV